MVDPLEVIIAYLSTNITQVENRVAAKHRFNGIWTLGQAAIVARQDGGDPDLYSPLSIVRLEMRIYGEDTAVIASLWGSLVELSRSTSRVTVPLPGGSALLQSFTQETGLSFLFDEDLSADYGMAFFEAIVSEQSIESEA